jgi:hypothetical protein
LGYAKGKGPYRNIVQFEYRKPKRKSRNAAWWVRFESKNFRRVKSFSYSKYGGKAAALVAAQKYRDAQERRRPAPLPRKSQTPGPGRVFFDMRFYRRVSDKKKVRYPAFVGYICIASKVCSTNYSVNKYGHVLARRMVQRWLDEKRKEQLVHEKATIRS